MSCFLLLLVFVVESHALIQHPKASLANGIIHGIRGEIGAIRPLNRTQYNSGLTKGCRVP